MKMRRELIHKCCGVLIAIFCLAGFPEQVYAAKGKAARSSSKAKKSSSHSSAKGLAQEWEPSLELKPYKSNYLLLYTYSSQPNNLPTSPNPLNQVLIPYALDNRDVKFQISLKYALADFQEYGAVWFGYTQLSLWQFYNKTNSQPFRETVYEPELIYSLRPTDFSILNLGAVHQSNGESNPRSRSWNRVYIQPGIEIIDDGSNRLLLQVRWWQRTQETLAGDDNPDIADFLGYREVELRYVQDGGWQVDAIARSKSIQLDVAAPWRTWFMLDGAEEGNLNIHLQYFSGYGETLLDYNQNHVNWGIGVSVPFN